MRGIGIEYPKGGVLVSSTLNFGGDKNEWNRAYYFLKVFHLCKRIEIIVQFIKYYLNLESYDNSENEYQ